MLRILIIEEDIRLSQEFAKLIDWEKNGFEILDVVSNGIIGRVKMQQQLPDIVLLSLNNIYLDAAYFIESASELNYPFQIIGLYNGTVPILKNDSNVSSLICKETLTAQVLENALRATAKKLRQQPKGSPKKTDIFFGRQRNNAILKILRGTTEKQYKKLKNQYSLSLADTHLCIIIVHSFGNPPFKNEQVEAFLSGAKRIVSAHSGGEFFLTEKQQLGIIINGIDCNEKFINYLFFFDIATKIAEQMKKVTGTSTCCIIEHDIETPLQLSKGFRSVCQLEDYLYFNAQQNVLSWLHIYNMKKNIEFLEIDRGLQETIEAVKRCNIAIIQRSLEELYLTILKQSMNIPAANYLKEKIEDVYCMCALNHAVRPDSGDVSHIREKEPSVEAELYKMKTLFVALVSQAMDRNKTLGPVVNKVTAYIQTNYSQEITLNSVAQYVKVSASYLSRLFKKRTGISFTQYVTNIRLEEAKQIFIFEKIKKIEDVAHRVGFLDSKYFCRVFKKYTGQSPFKYQSEAKRKAKAGIEGREEY